MTFLRRSLFLVLLGTALAIVPVEMSLGREATIGLLTGCGVALFIVVTSFFTLTWAFDKSTRVFLKAFVLGFLGRLAVIVATVIAISRVEWAHLATTAVSLLAFYGLLTFLEIRFFTSLLKALKEGKTE
ncbi:MAG: hypothetical protein ACE5OP_06760 [Candidatus Glassbacteria bacterium]